MNDYNSRTLKCNFVENVDYIEVSQTLDTIVSQNCEGSTTPPDKTANLAKNYLLSVSMAKELASEKESIANPRGYRSPFLARLNHAPWQNR